ncbi:MAG: HD domain-containing protein [Nitrospiraceae bacterium]|nr:HD domain-containing protein [Nitrospiraceae bacterium]
MLSAPSEEYQVHIENSLLQWDKISNRFLPSLSRLFETDEDSVNRSVRRMIFAHDIGKLSKRWQEAITAIANGKKQHTPPHAPLGAAYLLVWSKMFGVDGNLGNASVFAVLIHHIDSGVSGNSLESPDAQAILEGLVKGGTEIIWHEEGDEALRSLAFGDSILPLETVTLQSLTDLSDVLRSWSKCPRLLDQHRHRMLSSSLHHILKICDWRAATEREVDDKEKEVRRSVLEVLLNGGILP